MQKNIVLTNTTFITYFLQVKDFQKAQQFLIEDRSYRVRLFNCCSDLPATRSAMGLMGHSAAQGKKFLMKHYWI